MFFHVIREFTQRRWRRQRERQISNRFRQAKQQLCTCITLLCTFLCPSLHDYNLTGARSPEAPTIYPRATKVSYRETERAPKTYDSQAKFQWTNNKIPCSFCTFETTMENVWSSAICTKIFPQIKGKQTALYSENSLLWLPLQSSWSFSSENSVEWI